MNRRSIFSFLPAFLFPWRAKASVPSSSKQKSDWPGYTFRTQWDSPSGNGYSEWRMPSKPTPEDIDIYARGLAESLKRQIPWLPEDQEAKDARHEVANRAWIVSGLERRGITDTSWVADLSRHQACEMVNICFRTGATPHQSIV